jgi:hypothetical protein
MKSSLVARFFKPPAHHFVKVPGSIHTWECRCGARWVPGLRNLPRTFCPSPHD